MSFKNKNITNTLGEFDFCEDINFQENNEGILEDITIDTNYIPIVQKIIDIQNNMQEIDDYFDSLPELQSQKDEQLSDLLHYIENNELKPMQSIQIIKEIKKVRIERRNILNDIEIKRVYDSNRNKMVSSSQRQFFLSAICKRAKELNSEYKNRRYTNEEIEKILKGNKEN